MMDRERFAKLEEAFARANEAPEPERARVLDEIGAADSRLRAEVESLLEHGARRSEFIETPALGSGFAVRVEAAEDALPPGSAIGPYRIVRRIGAGGMGVVYEAVRVAAGFSQRVAVKLIKRGMDTEEIIRRFEAERGVLARLEHPGIARLIDGGATPDGRPWLAMEYVEGEPLGAWCDSRRLGLPARLGLFLAVCDAAAAAHRRLVVHRDLKPANILVTPEGHPKLLDFGIAKVIDPDAAAGSTVTDSSSRMMTPEYTAPEVIRGEPVSTAADVYSLGVILYELLCGARPFRLRTRSLAEAERVLLETEARAPSLMLRPTTRRAGVEQAPEAEEISRLRGESADRLRRRLRGDLDNIVLKAIQRDPRARYQSVPELADDLRRHLEGRPVSARRPTLRYRAGKFARRHWAPLTAGSVAVASLLALAIGVWWQAGVAMRQRDVALVAQDEAEVARDQAERITRFLQDMIESVEPGSRGPDVSMREALDVAAARLDERLAGHPQAMAEIRTTLGRSYASLGEYTSSVRELRRALALWQEATGQQSPEVATALGELATALYYHQEYEEAEDLLRQSLEATRQTYGTESAETAQVLNNLGALARARGEVDGAVGYHTEALRIRRQLLGEKHLDTAESLNNLSAAYRSLDRLDEAGRYLHESFEIRRELLPPEHPLVIQSESNLAILLMQIGGPGSLQQAEPMFRDVIARMEAAQGSRHPDLAYPMMHLSRLLRQTDRPEEAEATLRRVEAIVRGSLHPGDWRLVQAQLELGSLLMEEERYGEAEEVLKTAERELREPDADRARGEPRVREHLAVLYEAWGRPDEAAAYREENPGAPG
jgi:serine/threonine protein kinase/tetratricopeptide (TPR) repeat protein